MPAGPRDTRFEGFWARMPLAAVHGWTDEQPAALAPETVEVAGAAGRVLAADIAAAVSVPPANRAAVDGYAVIASSLFGASDYNPLTLPLSERGKAAGAPSEQETAQLVSMGEPLPEWADAVLPFSAARRTAGGIEAIEAAASGQGVERQAQELRAGDLLAQRGRVLRALDVAVLGELGIDQIEAIRRPRVALVVLGARVQSREARPRDGQDALGSLLATLVAGDGGAPYFAAQGDGARETLAHELATAEADLILVIGRTGSGPDDIAPLALADVGELVHHGIAIRPGGSAGVGRAEGRPVILLPGGPLGCVAAYELIAARLVRRLAGLPIEPLRPTLLARAARKIVSPIGTVDLCFVELVEGEVSPLPIFDGAALAAAVRSDGYVIVAPALEGFPPGAEVEMCIWPSREGRFL